MVSRRSGDAIEMKLYVPEERWKSFLHPEVPRLQVINQLLEPTVRDSERTCPRPDSFRLDARSLKGVVVNCSVHSVDPTRPYSSAAQLQNTRLRRGRHPFCDRVKKEKPVTGIQVKGGQQAEKSRTVYSEPWNFLQGRRVENS
ncbi:hypothetical protein E2C01_029342 [Portunus trituberculatus]|uniref:Uncharacterized protein n=1 Tax=Portunus trituberculatus TaxID=210409 RepID=A0A5B7ERQ3_PORTR|nr:hypothetical protein [Portunus trituberculatus]